MEKTSIWQRETCLCIFSCLKAFLVYIRWGGKNMCFSEPDVIQCFLVWVSYQADEDSVDWILGSKPGSDPLPLWISRCAALSEALGLLQGFGWF